MKSALATVLVHGMDGSEYDFRIFRQELSLLFDKLTNSTKLYILSSNVNANALTRDGIAIVSERLVLEVADWLKTSVLPDLNNTSSNPSPSDSSKKSLESVESSDLASEVEHVNLHFSIVGHSAGGLFSRHAIKSLLIGSLQEPPLFETLLKDFPNVKLVPTTFLSASSPHLGARRPVGVDFITKFMSSSGTIARYMFGVSGKDLFLADAETLAAESAAPTNSQDMRLLSRMTQGDYSEALKLFKFRCLAGVVRNDIVQFTSATVRTQNPFAQPLSFRTPHSQCRLLAHSGFHNEGLHPEKIFQDELHAFYMDKLFSDNAAVGEWTIEESNPIGTNPTSSQLLDQIKTDKIGEKLNDTTLDSPLDVVSNAFDEEMFPTLDSPLPKTETLHSKTLSTSSLGKKSPSGAGIRRLFKKDALPAPMERSASLDSIETSLSRKDSGKSTKSNKTKHRKNPSNGSEAETPSDWCIDAPHTLEFSKSMITNLQTLHFRRLAIRLDLSNPMYWLVTHPLVIGKPLKLVPEAVLEVGRTSAELLAQVLVVDFLAIQKGL
jgi:hypothetical protein